MKHAVYEFEWNIIEKLIPIFFHFKYQFENIYPPNRLLKISQTIKKDIWDNLTE